MSLPRGDTPRSLNISIEDLLVFIRLNIPAEYDRLRSHRGQLYLMKTGSDEWYPLDGHHETLNSYVNKLRYQMPEPPYMWEELDGVNEQIKHYGVEFDVYNDLIIHRI